MKFSLMLIGLAGVVAAEEKNLRVNVVPVNHEEKAPVDDFTSEHLDLEVIGEGGERELFPLLPGTR